MRYAINGIFATALHYAVLFLCIEYFQLSSIGLSNLFASLFGISISFLGNRFFVFQSKDDNFSHQATKFVFLYIIIAFIHGFILYIWSDIYNLNYNIGFVIAVLVQFFLGYLSSLYLVFNRQLIK